MKEVYSTVIQMDIKKDNMSNIEEPIADKSTLNKQELITNI